jgi:hypothetical protein
VNGYLLMFFFVSFIFWVLTLMMFARTFRLATTSAPSGESPAGRSSPQPASTTTAGGPAGSLAAPPSPPTAAEAQDGVVEAEAAPQEEVTRPAAMGGEPAAAAESGATAEAAAATAGASAAKVAETPSSGPQPTLKDMPEVVYGRHLLPNLVKVPLPRLLVKAHWTMEEAEARFRQEWEELEAESLRLSDWERHLGDRIQVVASCAAEEQAQLERECDVQQDKMHRVVDREIAVTHWEKEAT